MRVPENNMGSKIRWRNARVQKHIPLLNVPSVQQVAMQLCRIDDTKEVFADEPSLNSRETPGKRWNKRISELSPHLRYCVARVLRGHRLNQIFKLC
jgi:hypothetical protein